MLRGMLHCGKNLPPFHPVAPGSHRMQQTWHVEAAFQPEMLAS
jgi:hypothetical protein